MSTDVWLPACTEWIIKLNLGRDTPELEAVEIMGKSQRTYKMEGGCRASKCNKASC